MMLPSTRGHTRRPLYGTRVAPSGPEINVGWFAPEARGGEMRGWSNRSAPGMRHDLGEGARVTLLLAPSASSVGVQDDGAARVTGAPSQRRAGGVQELDLAHAVEGETPKLCVPAEVYAVEVYLNLRLPPEPLRPAIV